jgi:hypothetical protein
MMSSQLQYVDVRKEAVSSSIGRLHNRSLHDQKFHSPERERSAKPLCVGSIPTRASKLFIFIHKERHLNCPMLIDSFSWKPAKL